MPELSSITPIPQDVRKQTLPDPQQKVFEGKPFPLILTPQPEEEKTAKEWCKWVESERDNLRKLLEEHGAVLFRGFPIDTPEDFDTFSKAFGFANFPYIGGAAVRKVICGNVFTANESPPESRIPFHHEIGQQPVFPLNLFFYCDVPPAEGGQTSLVLSNIVYQRMAEREPEYVRKLEEEKVTYTRVLPDVDDPTSSIGRGWRSTYLTEDKEEAEKRCLANNTNFEWLPDGSMSTTTNPLPALRRDERSGKIMWHNSISGAYFGWRDSRNSPDKAIRFGNGDPMPESAMVTLEDVLDSNCIDFDWKKGDVVVVDNRICLHGRRWFKPPRRILAVLCKD